MDTPHLTEDEMADIKKEVLERLRPYLCDKIIADRHFDYLRSRKVLSREDAEEISCRTTHRKRTSKLLDYLGENPRGLDALLESIQLSRSANFIITKITDEVQRVKNERLQALKAGVSCGGCLPANCLGATNDLSRSLSDESNVEKACDSTLPFPQESEWSPSLAPPSPSLAPPSSSLATPSSSLAPPSSSLGLPSSSLAPPSSSLAPPSSSLPRPGDPGAPQPPDQLLSPSEGGASGGGAFQPLRSRSMNPPYPHST